MMYVVDVAFQVSKQFYVDASSPQAAASMTLAEIGSNPLISAREFESVLHTEVLDTFPMDIINFD